LQTSQQKLTQPAHLTLQSVPGTVCSRCGKGIMVQAGKYLLQCAECGHQEWGRLWRLSAQDAVAKFEAGLLLRIKSLFVFIAVIFYVTLLSQITCTASKSGRGNIKLGTFETRASIVLSGDNR
jgi:predicted RNA-binding Zn-ribbon protein involved in translation (DUF1610 family)